MLESEILSLQATVRYLQAENYGLRVPVGEVALREERNAWLDPKNLRRGRRVDEKKERLRREGTDVLDGLIELARDVKPVKLRRKDEAVKVSGKVQDMDRWVVARQREEVQRWNEWRDDLLKRGKVEMRGKIKSAKNEEERGEWSTLPQKVSDGMGKEVRIVSNSP